MATNKKITELTELVEADLANDDVLAIVDVSAGETFKVRKSTLASALAGVSTLAATTPVAVDQATGTVTISLNTVPITSGGTGATTASAALAALGGFADPLTTRGDIITRGASATQRLAVGAANRVLISDGTDPAYGQVPLASAVSGALPVANGGTNATSAGDARTNLGLGSIATQASSSVSITGGSVTGITDITVADGGTGASDASTARTNLGLVIGTDVQAYNAGISTTPLTEGLHTIFVPSAAMRPTVSNGCASITDVETTAGRPDLQVLDFDATADEHAQFQIAMPKSWNEGTITFRVWWTSTATDTDGVSWGLQGVACADGDTADVEYGTAVVVDDANQSTPEDVYVTDISGALTIAGTPAAGDICFFRIFRDVSDANDTATEDARLICVQILYTIDAGNDA